MKKYVLDKISKTKMTGKVSCENGNALEKGTSLIIMIHDVVKAQQGPMNSL